MTIEWDPKITRVTGKPVSTPAAETKTPKHARAIEPMQKPRGVAQPEAATTHPSRQAPASQSLVEREVEKLRTSLRAAGAARQAAAKQALQLATSYAMRRSRGARHAGLSLCEEVAERVPDEAPLAERTAAFLSAEGDLHETSAAGTLAACRKLVALLDQQSDALDAMARATLSSALIQLAGHFPEELAELELSIPETLGHALTLAEEAIAAAPELPDGHVALGRLLLCHDDNEALADAILVLEHALSLDPEHDAAEIALATALNAAQRDDEAAASIERVFKRGSSQPQAWLLRGTLALAAGRTDDAQRDLERAVRLAPEAGLFRLDAAAAAEAAGDQAAATEHDQQARALLGASYETLRKALGR